MLRFFIDAAHSAAGSFLRALLVLVLIAIVSLPAFASCLTAPAIIFHLEQKWDGGQTAPPFGFLSRPTGDCRLLGYGYDPVGSQCKIYEGDPFARYCVHNLWVNYACGEIVDLLPEMAVKRSSVHWAPRDFHVACILLWSADGVYGLVLKHNNDALFAQGRKPTIGPIINPFQPDERDQNGVRIPRGLHFTLPIFKFGGT